MYRKFVGPSQFATVLGLNPYQTREHFKSEIENGYIPISNKAKQYGIDHEQIALDYYQYTFGCQLIKPTFVVDSANPRIGGICDALIDGTTGLEIKCHTSVDNLLTTIPDTYLMQVIGYMYLYKCTSWVLFSCAFDQNNMVCKYIDHHLNWKTYEDDWYHKWFPQILEFVENVKWKK